MGEYGHFFPMVPLARRLEAHGHSVVVLTQEPYRDEVERFGFRVIGVDPSRVYPVAGLNLSNLARLCDAAIGATGIADGVVDSPYLLKIGTGLRWYIPVQNQSRGSSNKTYRVAPDGAKPEVF